MNNNKKATIFSLLKKKKKSPENYFLRKGYFVHTTLFLSEFDKSYLFFSPHRMDYNYCKGELNVTWGRGLKKKDIKGNRKSNNDVEC